MRFLVGSSKRQIEKQGEEKRERERRRQGTEADCAS